MTDTEFLLLGAGKPARTARRGRVRLDRRVFVDDDGPFRPLGATLMWALYGWHEGDRARVEQQLAHLSKHGFDSVRILAEVGWPTETIDPAWPDYDELLTSLIDCIYDTYGMRTELVLSGGGTGYPPVTLAHRISELLVGREHKILYLECANEMQGVNIPLLTRMVPILQRTGIPVAATNGERVEIPTGEIMYLTGADVATVHPDRGVTTPDDADWRQVRQIWDWQGLPSPVANNEPPGPRSSIEENVDPLQMAMMRACGFICGSGAFVLHNGAGVSGRVDPFHNRPANLWEVPNIDAIEDAVRAVDDLVPVGAENWPKANTWWLDNPLVIDSGTTVGEDHGAVCCKTAYTDDQFCSILLGVKNFVRCTTRGSWRVTATKCSAPALFGPMTTSVELEQHVQEGQGFSLSGVPDAHVAYVIRGAR